MNEPIRVLHIVGGVMDVGGIEMFLMNYYRHIDRSKIQFDFCIVEEGGGHFDQEILSLGAIIYNLPNKKRHPIEHIRKLSKVLSQYRQLPVHMHLDGMNGVYGSLALLNKNSIRISHSHNTNHLTTNHLKRFIHDGSRLLNRIVNNHFAACSKEASLWLHGKRITKKYTLIRNAIDTKKFKFNPQLREEYQKKFNISNEVVIGHVGRFHPQKNHHFMIQIASELKKTDYKFKMVFVGTGELLDEINHITKQNNLEENIIFIGKSDTPQDYFHMFDIYLLPSLFEGLGISLVEAQTNGLTCLIAKSIPQEAIFNSNVITVPTYDIELWSKEIVKLEMKRVFPTKNPYEISLNIFLLLSFYNGAVQL